MYSRNINHSVLACYSFFLCHNKTQSKTEKAANTVVVLVRSDKIQMLHEKLERVIVAVWQSVEEFTKPQVTIVGVLATICRQKLTVLLCTHAHSHRSTIHSHHKHTALTQSPQPMSITKTIILTLVLFLYLVLQVKSL